MSKSFLLRMEYDGTDYFGWQIQNNSKYKTIQGELERCLKLINKTGFLRSLGASRTDRGVHAKDQVCRVDLDYNISSIGLKKALNDLLPPSIYIRSSEEVSSTFHPIRDVKSKTYSYYFSHEECDPFQGRFLTQISKPIDEKKFKAAMNKIIGIHNFQNFYTLGSEPVGTEREIFNCVLSRKIERGKEIFCFEISGSGFLKQMVRLLLGAIVRVSFGEVSVSKFEEYLKEKKTDKLSAVMKPEGLFLKEIFIVS